MSIGPVQNFGPVTEAPSAKASPAADSSQTTASQREAAGKIAQSEMGTLPNQKEPGVKNLSSAAELPQEEVQVQRDSEIRDEVVIKYLNTATGDLILQVPSAEVLSVDHGIYQEFQQQAKLRESAGAVTVADRPSRPGEEPHGN